MNGEIFICQVYVDDIIFGSTNEDFCKEFGDLMSKVFEMSMIGELSFILRFQIKQMKEGVFISQEKYTHRSSQEVQYDGLQGKDSHGIKWASRLGLGR